MSGVKEEGGDRLRLPFLVEVVMKKLEPLSRLNADGHEILDNSPVAIPLRFKRQENLSEEVRRLVQGELSRLADARGYESFDEADDFDVGDDYDPHSPYELDEEQIYYDHRNERRDDTEEGVVDKGDQQVAEDVQRDGKGVKKGSKRSPPDKRSARSDDKVTPTPLNETEE